VLLPILDRLEWKQHKSLSLQQEEESFSFATMEQVLFAANANVPSLKNASHTESYSNFMYFCIIFIYKCCLLLVLQSHA